MLSPEIAKMYGNLIAPSPIYHSVFRSAAHLQHGSASFLMENLLREEAAQHGFVPRPMADSPSTSGSPSPRKDTDSKPRSPTHTSSEAPFLKFGVHAILSSEVSPKSASSYPPTSSSAFSSYSAQAAMAFSHHKSTCTLSNNGLACPTCSPRQLYDSSMFNPMFRSPFYSASSMFPLPPNTFSFLNNMRGKPRRGMLRRAVFSDAQRRGLEKTFQKMKYISKPDRKKLAAKLGLKDSQVKIWFQNRRMKWRNSKERELLSTGGTRESTLPGKNNQNPDLSDAKNETKIDIDDISLDGDRDLLSSPVSSPPGSPRPDMHNDTGSISSDSDCEDITVS